MSGPCKGEIEVRDTHPKTYNLSPETFKSRLPKAVGFFVWIKLHRVLPLSFTFCQRFLLKKVHIFELCKSYLYIL